MSTDQIAREAVERATAKATDYLLTACLCSVVLGMINILLLAAVLIVVIVK